MNYPNRGSFAALFSRRQSNAADQIDSRIRSLLGATGVGFHVHSKEFPQYRFVDLYNAVSDSPQEQTDVNTIFSEHPQEDLNGILNAAIPRWASRDIKNSNLVSWPIDYHRERSLPVDCFWVYPESGSGTGSHCVVRLRFDSFRGKCILEVASPTGSVAELRLEAIVARSITGSIYRNKILELAYEAGTKDEYGDVERPGQLRLLFKAVEPVDDQDIIISDDVRKILWRNVIDLHERRELLKSLQVPVRRGLLLYGPPGTGKTFACRYLCAKLDRATRIIVAGMALLQVNSIFSLARMLQPSLVILEDVDLVFSSREINLYSSVLGDLLDQMDGLRPHEDIGFVLTTNAIDRMEAAIKDRPGRISQCIHFGEPEPELRRRYLLHYLGRYEIAKLDVDGLVHDSKGATQAFLKEWVHRSVQIASERIGSGDQVVSLRNEDFSTAMDEMRRFSEGETGRIIGFHS